MHAQRQFTNTRSRAHTGQSADLEQSMRRASQLGSSPAGKSRRGGGRRTDAGDGTFLTSVPGEERLHHLPTVEALNVQASEDLEERLDALGQAIGLEGIKLLKAALKAEFTHICRLSREDEKESLMQQGQGMENAELRRLLKEEEQLREAAQAASDMLQDQMRIVAQRTQELTAKNEAMESMDGQLRQQVCMSLSVSLSRSLCCSLLSSLFSRLSSLFSFLSRSFSHSLSRSCSRVHARVLSLFSLACALSLPPRPLSRSHFYFLSVSLYMSLTLK